MIAKDVFLSVMPRNIKFLLLLQKQYFIPYGVFRPFSLKNHIFTIMECKCRTKQMDFIISGVFPSVVKREILFVPLLSQTQQQHKSYIPLQMLPMRDPNFTVVDD